MTTEREGIQLLLIQKNPHSNLKTDFLGGGYSFTYGRSIEKAEELMVSESFDIILIDLNPPTSKGLGSLKSVIRLAGTIPIVVLISKSEEHIGVQAMENGAQDYLFIDKPFSSEMLKKMVRYAIERNKNVRTIKQYENSLKITQEIAKMGPWTWYPERDEFIPSEAFLKIFNIPGLKKSDSFLKFLRRVHPADQIKIQNALQSHSKRLDSFSLEFRVYSKNGELKHILLRGDLQDSTGKDGPVYYGTGQDITEVKSTTEDIIQKNRFLELTGEIAGVGGWELNLKTKKLFWSKSTYSIHGMPESFNPTIDNIKLLFDDKGLNVLRKKFNYSAAEKKSFFVQVPFHTNSTTKWLQYIGKFVYEDNEPVAMSGIVQDISDSKRQLEKIRVRAMMLDNVNEAAIAVDKNWKIIFWNKAAEKLLKYTRAETIGKSLNQFQLVDLPESKVKEVILQLYNGRSVSGEYGMIDRDGRKFPAWVSNSSIFDQEGRVEAMLSIVRDISSEKDYLQKIEDSEIRFRNLFEFSPLGIGLIDLKNGNWIDANNKLTSLLGYTMEELSGLTYMDITPDIYKEEDSKRKKGLLKNGVFGPYQKEYIKKDGTLLKVILTGFIVADSEKNKKAWTHVLDISELEEKTESLRQTEERFKDYVENSTDVIVSIDAKGTVVYVSVNIENMLGYECQEIVGKSVFDLVHPEDNSEMRDSFNMASTNLNEVGRITTRIKNKNGDYIWIQADGNMRKAPDRSIYGILIVRDIDNERKSELRVRQQNKILKDIAFIQSHILRRPLANILGILAINTMKENIPEDTSRLLEIIKKEAEIMDQIVVEIVEKSTDLNKLSDDGE